MAIGDSLHISEMTLPEGVESVALSHGEEHDLAVVSILHRGGSSTTEETAERPEVAPGDVPTAGDEAAADEE
jgi:large subunit ribosomal protein L25